MIQRKVMEVTQRIQPVQDKACILFVKIESQGEELKQVIITAEQGLEGAVNDTVILEFTQQEATVGRSSSIHAQGLRSRVVKTRVTQDESQVSVGGLLALDQVLG
jgi:hypothetical protein